MFLLVLYFCPLLCVFCVSVLFCALCLRLHIQLSVSYFCTVCRLLPQAANSTAVQKYHIAYHIKLHIISYQTSYHIVSYHIKLHIISNFISYQTSYHIKLHIISNFISYHIKLHIISNFISYHILSNFIFLPSSCFPVIECGAMQCSAVWTRGASTFRHHPILYPAGRFAATADRARDKRGGFPHSPPTAQLILSSVKLCLS